MSEWRKSRQRRVIDAAVSLRHERGVPFTFSLPDLASASALTVKD